MTTNATATATMTVKITPNDKGNPPGKLADAERDHILATLRCNNATGREPRSNCASLRRSCFES